MADGARQVRIFVSSPGDARFERSRLERVIERLNGEFAGVARLSVIRWNSFNCYHYSIVSADRLRRTASPPFFRRRVAILDWDAEGEGTGAKRIDGAL